MNDVFISVITQSLTFFPLALAITVSYSIMRATDMTLDGSFVLGAGLFARLVTLGFSPLFAVSAALIGGLCAGMMVSFIQRDGKVDSLLAGILAAFILTSFNLILMGRPNINLLSHVTLFSSLFARAELLGWIAVGSCCLLLAILVYHIATTRIGLMLRALGDNPTLLKRQGKNIEVIRTTGFALTNMLAASAGCLTAQTVGYADISIGLGMTLTGIGAILLGQQMVRRVRKRAYFRIGSELAACLVGIFLYFLTMNTLLRLRIDPIYLKMLMGMLLIAFLRSAHNRQEKAYARST